MWDMTLCFMQKPIMGKYRLADEVLELITDLSPALLYLIWQGTVNQWGSGFKP